jgi:rhodanese-related sulfurtransferase
VTATIEEIVERARRRINRVQPHELEQIAARGGLLVDIRPVAQRAAEGEFPGAHCIERNVLEWRLDPAGADRVNEVVGYDQPVVVICSEGYASSLAAASLADLGYRHASDLDGGFVAWRAWVSAGGSAPDSAQPVSPHP